MDELEKLNISFFLQFVLATPLDGTMISVVGLVCGIAAAGLPLARSSPGRNIGEYNVDNIGPPEEDKKTTTSAVVAGFTKSSSINPAKHDAPVVAGTG